MGSRRLADNQVASVSLPPSMFERITDREDVGVFFALYNENSLFPVRDASTSGTAREVVGSTVVASTVGPRLSFENLEDPVEINHRLMSMPDSVSNSAAFQCHMLIG